MEAQRLEFLDVTIFWIHVLTIFGLSNLKESGRKSNKIVYVISVLKIFYSIFLMILYVALLYVQIVYFSEERPKGLTGIYMYYSGFPVAILIILLELVETKTTGVLMTRLVQVEFQFPKSDGKLVSKRSTTLFLAFSFVFIASISYDTYSNYVIGFTVERIYFLFSCYVFLFYNYIAVIHFSMLQFWLENGFVRINEDLNAFCKQEADSTAHAGKADFLTMNDIISSSGVPFNNNFMARKVKTKTSAALEIRKLRSLYNEVYKLSCEANKLYSIQHLILVSSNFIMVIILLFNTIISVEIYSKIPELANAMTLGTYIKGSFLTISTIFGLIWSCCRTSEEASATGSIIQNHLIHISDGDTQKELKNFSDLLLHEKIVFSPFGFFRLENGMILSMLASVTSYLVILIQFAEIPASQNNNTCNIS